MNLINYYHDKHIKKTLQKLQKFGTFYNEFYIKILKN